MMVRRRFQKRWPVAAVVVVALVVLTRSLLAAGQSFTFLQAGFTQEVFGVAGTFMGGVAFAPDGDPWVDECSSFGSSLHRYDLQTTIGPVNGTTLHPETIVASDGGCGLTNHPNGALYTNQSGGVAKLDANTGAHLAGPFGPAGNALGIAPDPQTGNLTYVGSNGTIYFVDAAFTTSGTFSAATTGDFIDGIAWDPTGTYLFLSDRSPSLKLVILDRTGAVVQNVLTPSEPDGIAFHAVSPKFVLVSNTDGTMTRFDFPADDFTQTPILSAFATGGFRGDLAQVGPDGCLYLTQDGTRYDDGTVTGQDSLVRICGGFAPPPGVGSLPGIMDTDGSIRRVDLDRDKDKNKKHWHFWERKERGEKDRDDDRVSVDANLNCDPTKKPRELIVKWEGKSFVLTTQTSATCSDDPNLPGDDPKAGFDKYEGAGTGKLNGRPGYSATWVLTDSGIRHKDGVKIQIVDPLLNVILDVDGFLTSGRNEAKPDTN
jgi:hypothetical protein